MIMNDFKEIKLLPQFIHAQIFILDFMVLLTYCQRAIIKLFIPIVYKNSF